ncbi:MAG: FHA domain-containing protein [Lentisphaerae bacterium]|nr:FHA domain-containing protein [Lentisphaerota bacterium]
MDSRPHLIIHAGPDAGREICITDPAGVRAGRSSKNGVVLQDPKTSRYHCRFFIKPGDGLFVSDLGSANQTLVNNASIREVRLHVGDLVTLGDTVIKVVDDASGGLPGPTVAAPVDLGLESTPPAARPGPARRPWRRGPLLLALGLVCLFAVGAWIPYLFRSPAPTPPPAPAPSPRTLEIDYEKVLGDTNRIFRYHFHLSADRHLVVTIDDTGSTHLQEESTLTPELVAELAAFIDDADFWTLQDEYQGLQPRTFDQWDITVTIGRKAKRCRVVNRAEPAPFKVVREKFENFAQVELGLWAVQYPPAQLEAMGRDAFLNGRKLYDERDVRHGNLAEAIRRLKEADFYLKTLSPKPDFYPELTTALADCTAELDRRYVDQNFLANRAMRSKEWQQAAEELRVLCDMLGDQSDPRYEESRRKLREVESRLNLQRK